MHPNDEEGTTVTIDGRARWLALYVLCLGDLMIVLDGTIVNVALPTIRDDLGFSETSLAWVVNPICSRLAASCCSAVASAISTGSDACS